MLDDVVIEAMNEKESRPDPTAHAEVLALREAASRRQAWRLGGVMYVSKEPCIMCAGALIAARVERVVFGAYDPKAGAAGSVVDLFTSAAANHHVVVQGGVLEEEARLLLQGFFHDRRKSRTQESPKERNLL